MVRGSYPRPVAAAGGAALNGGENPMTRIPLRSGDDQPGQAYHAIVKNTFSQALDTNLPGDNVRRSASDSDLSRSSGEDKMRFWLPSLSSKSSPSTSSDNRSRPDMVVKSSNSSLPLQCLQSCAIVGNCPDHHATGVASEAFGLPTLCNAIDHTGVTTDTANWRDTGTVEAEIVPAVLRQSAMQVGPNALLRTYVPAVNGSTATSSTGPAYIVANSVPPTLVADVGACGYLVDRIIEQLHKETKVPLGELQTLHEQGLLLQIPRNDFGEVTSVGSIKHEVGSCSPCLFWFRDACAKGIQCDYCHFRHKGQRKKRIRPSKRTRKQMRQQVGYTNAVACSPEDGDSSNDGSINNDGTQQHVARSTLNV